MVLTAGHWAGGNIVITANNNDITIIGGMSFIGSIANDCPTAKIVAQLT
jgi:hypothetical protein